MSRKTFFLSHLQTHGCENNLLVQRCVSTSSSRTFLPYFSRSFLVSKTMRRDLKFYFLHFEAFFRKICRQCFFSDEWIQSFCDFRSRYECSGDGKELMWRNLISKFCPGVQETSRNFPFLAGSCNAIFSMSHIFYVARALTKLISGSKCNLQMPQWKITKSTLNT